MAIVQINREGIEKTLGFLKQAGKRQAECVVLWLAKKRNDVLIVQAVYLPRQTADYDFFHIPQESILELLKYLRYNKLAVAAQVHTHPARAFHSVADDQWAIIRHVGGLSLVLPHFAATVTPDDFIKKVAVFRLSEINKWDEIPSGEKILHFTVTS